MATKKCVCYKSDFDFLLNEVARAKEHLSKGDVGSCQHDLDLIKTAIISTRDNSEKRFIKVPGE